MQQRRKQGRQKGQRTYIRSPVLQSVVLMGRAHDRCVAEHLDWIRSHGSWRAAVESQLVKRPTVLRDWVGNTENSERTALVAQSVRAVALRRGFGNGEKKC